MRLFRQLGRSGSVLPTLALLLMAGLAAAPSLQAQDGRPATIQEPASQYRWLPAAPDADTRKTAQGHDTLALPFFDAFNQQQLYADSSLWQSYRTVFLNRSSALEAPDAGVALLDGRKPDAQPLVVGNNGNITGRTDSLVSKPLRLAQYSSADSLYLSFSFQAGGPMNAPEPDQDSLLVFFKTQDTVDSINSSEYIEVWSGFNTLDTVENQRFYEAKIALDTAQYEHNWFYDGFQFKIVRIGYVEGLFDIFFLDRVLMDQGRRLQSEPQPDVAIQRVEGLPFDSLNAIPFRNFTTTAPDSFGAMKVRLRNFSDQQQQRQLVATLRDTSFGVTVHEQTFSLTLLPQSQDSVFVRFPIPAIGDPRALRMNFKLAEDSTDRFAQNDAVFVDASIHSWHEPLDGEIETGFGLNANRGFGHHYHFEQRDTLQAIDLLFQAHDDLRGSSIELAVWEGDPNMSGSPGNDNRDDPDDPSLSEFTVANYPLEPPYRYRRYELDSAAALQGHYVIGLIQRNNEPLGLGRDLNTQYGPIWFNFNGNWTKARKDDFPGTLGIRLKLSSGRNFAPVQAPAAQPASADLTLYPNPLGPDQALHYRLPSPQRLVQLEYRLISARGRTLQSHGRRLDGSIHREGRITHALKPGVYYLLLRTTTAAGRNDIYRQAFTVQAR